MLLVVCFAGPFSAVACCYRFSCIFLRIVTDLFVRIKRPALGEGGGSGGSVVPAGAAVGRPE